MINWLFQAAIDISIIIGIILLIRIPVAKYLGANIAYWLWLVPFLRLIVWFKTEVPLTLLEKVHFADGKVLIKVFKNPNSYQLTSYATLENIWLLGILIWIVFRIVGWVNFQKYLQYSSKPIDIKTIFPNITLFKNYKNVQFFETKIPEAPFITGLIKPKLFLPKDNFVNYSYSQQLCVLKHEFIHLNRKDLWIQILAEIMRAIFWFNPIVHLAISYFRQDQELACDYSVLAKSTNEERLAYGRVLIKGLHAHALPATLAFFNNQKQRFSMLEKHHNSTFKNILGLSLCAIITTFALTKAPETIASDETFAENEVSFNFNDIPLKDILQLIRDATNREIIGYNKLPAINISLEASHVDALELERLILKCTGFKLTNKGKYFELEENNLSSVDINKSNDCINTINPQP